MSDVTAAASFSDLLNELSRNPAAESVDEWPTAQLQAMVQAGIPAWDIPLEFGGVNLDSTEMLDRLRRLAARCLVSTFIWTQRSAAVRRIGTSANNPLRQKLLPQLLNGEIFATVGISHLTTSGRHLRAPLVQAAKTADGFILNGLAPWATGATQADYLITGGTLDDQAEILVALPTDRKGVQVQAPVDLMALSSSQTGAVKLENVAVTNQEVLHGPVEKVMQQGTGGGAGSLGTSALAVGRAEGMLIGLQQELHKRPDLAEFVTPLQREADELQAMIMQSTMLAASAEEVRQRANSLVLRTAQAWLATTKGAGFVAGHPAERAVRESMFFLVWSCPQPVLSQNLREFSCSPRR